MKAIEVLEWICRCSICGEDLFLIDVPKEDYDGFGQNEEWWINQFGYCPPAPIQAGRYLYFYLSSTGEPISTQMGVQEPDVEIEAGYNENQGGWDYIYLYKLED